MIHGGVVLDSLINYLDKFGRELLYIQFGFLVIVSTLFLWLWFSNRRKYHNLKHAIPANIVKSYLDSIIQNSTALKSSLFRGGGVEVNGIPSVIPLGSLMGGENIAISGAPSTALMEELNQKKAYIATLESQLSSSQNSQRDLEAKLGQTLKDLAAAQAKIKELEALLAESKSTGGGDEALKSELAMVTKERNEYRDRLKEFEIISDDLANLKRLQQENEQLKRSLAARGESLGNLPSFDEPSMASVAPSADVSDILEDITGGGLELNADNKALEDFLNSPEVSAINETDEPSLENNPVVEEDNSEAEMLAALGGGPSAEPEAEMMAALGSSPSAEPEVVVAPPSGPSPEEEMMAALTATTTAIDDVPISEKTPEDLLSEFEKMLG